MIIKRQKKKTDFTQEKRCKEENKNFFRVLEEESDSD